MTGIGRVRADSFEDLRRSANSRPVDGYAGGCCIQPVARASHPAQSAGQL